MFRKLFMKTIMLVAFSVGLFFLLSMQPLVLHAQESDEEEERAKYQPYRDYSEDWRLGSLFGITPEDGVLLGTGAIVYKFGFREFPYIYRMSLVGGATIPTGRWKFVYTAKFPTLANNLALDILAYASEIEVRNFYGFGNNTSLDERLEKDNFYRVASRQYLIQPILSLTLNEITKLRFGTSFKHFDIRHSLGRFIALFPLDSIGDRRSVLGMGVALDIAFGDAAVATRNGFYFSASAWNSNDI
jgi:hypothetical protein